MNSPRTALPLSALRLAALAAAALLLLAASPGRANDYPTEVVADYVLACMAANNNTAEALRQCSCSIDVLASLLSYQDYSMAETVLRMRQVSGGGEKMALFRETSFARTTVDRLRRAQVEAEVRCFL
jgi:hypothetical protein